MATQTYQIEAKLVASGAKAFQSAFSNAEDSLKKFNESGQKISAVGDNMSAVGGKLTKTVTLPLLAIGTAAVGTAAKFESSMSEVRAISGATGDDMESLEKLAREMGATTKFSASEAADGLKYMAMAGWDTQSMMDGLPGVLDLAAASGTDLGTTSDIVTDALTAFGLEAKDAGDFADLLASASSNSNTNVVMMGESFKHVAPVMGALGASTDDTALALGLMANAGIKGSQAGTSLRKMMTSLVKPTDEAAILMQKYGIELVKNADGTVDFKGTMDNLRSSLQDLDPVQQSQIANTIFGERAMTSALAIVNASEEDYASLADATNDYSGAAKEMADTMQDNLQGAWVELKSALSEAAISIGEILIPIIRDVVEWIKDWVGKFSNLNDGTKKTIVYIGLFVAAIGPAISILGKMTSGVGGAISAVSKFASAATGGAGAAKNLGGVMGALASPAGIATVAIGAVVTAVGFLITDLFTATKETRNLIKATEDSAVAYGNTMGSIKTNNIVLDNMADRLLELQNQTSLSASEQEEMKRIVDELNSSIPDMNLSIDEQTGLLNMSEEAMLAYVESAKARAEQDALYERQIELKKEELELNEQLAEAEKRLEEAGLLNHRARAKAANDINAINEKLEENAASLVANEEAWDKNAETVQASQEKQTEIVGENTELRIEMTDEELLAYEQAQLDKQLADEAAAEAMAAALAEQQAAYDAYYEELATKTEDIYQKMGGLGDGAVEKIELTAADVKKNLEEQIADWNSWQTGLAEIQGRVPEVMVQELKKIGPAALPLLEEYNNMTDKELSEHVKLYEDKHALARQMALDELGPLPDEAKNVLDQTTGYVHEVGADMYSEAKRFGQQGVEGYASTKDDFANTAVDITDAGLNAASNKIGQMGDVGANAGDAYAGGVEDSAGQSSVAGDELAQSAVDSARDTQIISAWRMAGVNSAESYGLGVEFKLGDVAGAGKSIAVGARDAAGKISTYSTGQNFGQTFANGISSKWNQAYNAGYSLGLAANQGQRDALNIKSPSRVAKENAENFGQSFVDNLLKMKDKAFAAGKEFTQAALSPLEQPVNVSMGYPSSLSSTGGRQSGSVEYGGGITQNITIQSPEPMSASDNARRIKQASRELALEW